MDLRRLGGGMAWEGVFGAHGHGFPLLTKGMADFRSVWIAYGKRMDCVLTLRLKATVSLGAWTSERSLWRLSPKIIIFCRRKNLEDYSIKCSSRTHFGPLGGSNYKLVLLSLVLHPI